MDTYQREEEMGTEYGDKRGWAKESNRKRALNELRINPQHLNSEVEITPG